jgi:hypothetical protein
VVEDNDGVIEGEREIGESAVIGGNVRKIFGVTNNVIAGESYGTAEESGEPGEGHCGAVVEEFLEFAEWIGVGDLATFAGAGFDRNGATSGGEHEKRIAAHETVASHAFATDDAFEEEGPGSGGNSLPGGDWGERVSGELSVDRYEAGFAGQFFKFCRGGE